MTELEMVLNGIDEVEKCHRVNSALTLSALKNNAE